MGFFFDDGLSFRESAAIVGVAAIIITGIIVAAGRQIINLQGAGLLMDGMLTIATLGYVLLTCHMVSEMRRDADIRKQHQNRPHVIDRLESGLLPLANDIRRVRLVLSDGETEWDGPDGIVIDEELYRSYHDVTSGYGAHNIPRFTAHLDVDNGLTYDVYQSLDQYSNAYQEAMYELQRLILELDGFEGNSEMVRDFAVFALKGEDRYSAPSLWDNWRDDIVPLRDEIPELMAELEKGRNELTSACGAALRELESEQNESMNEYQISEAELV